MTIALGTALAAGFLTFLSPCVLPLVPVYLASLTTADINSLSNSRMQLTARAVSFSLGFVAVFTVMGMAASQIGLFITAHRLAFQTLGGLLILLLGLKLVGAVQIPWLERAWRIDDRRLHGRHGIIPAFAMGLVFAAAWSPCIGPVLGSILTYTASTTSNPVLGATYLAAYGAGIALPLLVVAVFAESGLGFLRRVRRGLPVFERVLGALLLLVATSLLFEWNLGPSIAIPAKIAAPVDQAAPGDALTTNAGTMLELFSKDCSVCQEMEPVVESLTASCRSSRVSIQKIDVSLDANRHFIETYRLVGVPTFVFLGTKGDEVARLVGKQDQQALSQALAALSGQKCDGVNALPPAPAATPPLSKTSCAVADDKCS